MERGEGLRFLNPKEISLVQISEYLSLLSIFVKRCFIKQKHKTYIFGVWEKVANYRCPIETIFKNSEKSPGKHR